ncbi:MAG TPA: ABC transporter substrate-binding protein [Methylomirabilota bacterium]|jgi:ABC-type transporter MlaC component
MWHSVVTGSRDAWRALSEALITSRARPEDALRTGLGRMKSVLSSGRSPQVVRAEFRRVLNDVLHVPQIARGALWAHWGRLTPTDQRQFVAQFTDFLERLIVAQLRQLRWVTIRPVSEVVGDRTASVTWRIATSDTAAILEYRLHWRDGRWKICDALVNGHSFVAGCREDFDRTIRASSFRALIADLARRDHAGFVGPGFTLTAAASQ